MNMPSAGKYDILTLMGIDTSQYQQGLGGAGAAADEAGQKMDKVLNVALAAGAAAF